MLVPSCFRVVKVSLICKVSALERVEWLCVYPGDHPQSEYCLHPLMHLEIVPLS